MMDAEQQKIAADFDRLSETYSHAVDKSLPVLKADYFTRVKAESLSALARRQFGDTSKLVALDFGCGVGNYHGLLKHDFGKIFGCDVSSECLKVAQRRNPEVEYRSYDGVRVPFDDGSFDIAFAITVFHHIPQRSWLDAVREVRRVMRPGGLFLIYEHNPYNPVTRWVVDNCPFDANATLLNRRTATGLLSGAGFEDVSARSILTVPPTGAVGRALDGAFGRLALGAQYYAKGTCPGGKQTSC